MFVQQINFATDDPEGVLALAEEWAADAVDNGTVLNTDFGVDADNPGQHVWMVHFETAESAQQNSDRPETGKLAARFSAMCSEGPAFRNIEVIRRWPS